MNQVVIVDNIRTGLAKAHRGRFNLTRSDDMLAHCIDALLERNPTLDPAEVEDVVAGMARQTGEQSANIARHAVVLSRLPMTVKWRKLVNKETKETAIAEGTVDRDECNRPDTTAEGLAKLKPVFAIPRLLKYKGLNLDDIDLVELNEAFASQCLYCRDALGIDNEIYNVNGGSIAIGHPFGMTGSRMTGLVIRELRRRNKKLVLVSICIGKGMGAAGLFEAC